MFLYGLTQSIRGIRGIGPQIQSDFGRLDIYSVYDLLTHFPRRYEDRKTIRRFADADSTGTVNTIAEILDVQHFGRNFQKNVKFLLRDESGTGSLLAFGRGFLTKQFNIGEKVRVFGYFQYHRQELQASQFEIEHVPRDDLTSENPIASKTSKFGNILGIYPLAGNLTQQRIRNSINEALRLYDKGVDEHLPASLLEIYDYPEVSDALKMVHFPVSPEDAKKAQKRFRHEELFLLQIQTLLQKFRRQAEQKPQVPYQRGLREKVEKSLPFALTKDQQTALKDMEKDFMSSHPSFRLLQGDVGSGKTLVAFLSALPYIEAGKQAVLMAPTELLALQHAEEAGKVLSSIGVKIAFLSGTTAKKSREYLKDALKSGNLDMLIGTHALFSQDILFKDLGLIIIDEQHRFGVDQRERLRAKSPKADTLVMTATPIPRTLTLTLFGDMEISVIKSMPAGRKPVKTHLAVFGNEKKVYDWVRNELEKGHQAYFVYPAIEESPALALKNTESMYKKLQEEVFRNFSCGLIHSRVSDDEKQKTMEDFENGKVQVLVATSVVEVGVNVPNATCMVVEHAERFGLSALHQLRGRVGRSNLQSYAFLIYSSELTEEGKQRLLLLKETTDGFVLAEKDLEMRGPGNVAGKQQSGFLRFRIASLPEDLELMKIARKNAASILETDPGLLNAENRGIRTFLKECAEK